MQSCPLHGEGSLFSRPSTPTAGAAPAWPKLGRLSEQALIQRARWASRFASRRAPRTPKKEDGGIRDCVRVSLERSGGAVSALARSRGQVNSTFLSLSVHITINLAIVTVPQDRLADA